MFYALVLELIAYACAAEGSRKLPRGISWRELKAAEQSRLEAEPTVLNFIQSKPTLQGFLLSLIEQVKMVWGTIKKQTEIDR